MLVGQMLTISDDRMQIEFSQTKQFKIMRNEIFDIARGIVLILMVIGHSNAPKEIHDFIYLFHIPAFYFISGYFFKDCALEKKWNFIKRKLQQLYRPFVTYGLVFLAISPILFHIHFIEKQYSFMEITKRAIGILFFKDVEQLLVPFWFLRSLFTVSVLFLFIKFICCI